MCEGPPCVLLNDLITKLFVRGVLYVVPHMNNFKLYHIHYYYALHGLILPSNVFWCHSTQLKCAQFAKTVWYGTLRSIGRG